VVLFAFFLALGFSYEKERSAPLAVLFHTAARCFYHLAGLFTEVLSLVFIVIAAYWAVRFHGALVSGGMQGLLVLATVFTAAAGLVVMPLLVFFFVAPRGKFGATLLGVLGQTLTALFSGSITFSLPVLFRSANENFHIRRSAFGVTAPLCAAFGRAGSTAIAAAAFLILLRSYSPLVLGPLVILIVFGLSLLFTPLLSHRPGDAVWSALASFCAVYGSGCETACLALQPVVFYLITLGAFLDTLLASFITLAVAVQKDFIKVKKPWQPK
jgi:Na+/H+-dicarboxylate symporter